MPLEIEPFVPFVIGSSHTACLHIKRVEAELGRPLTDDEYDDICQDAEASRRDSWLS